jgi:hypothetical protein
MGAFRASAALQRMFQMAKNYVFRIIDRRETRFSFPTPIARSSAKATDGTEGILRRDSLGLSSRGSKATEIAPGE